MPEQCEANNRFLSLPSHYQRQSNFSLTSLDKTLLQGLNISTEVLWLPFHEQFKNTKSISVKIPDLLPEVKQVNMNYLIDRLNRLRAENQLLSESKFKIIPYLVGGLACIICSAVVFAFIKFQILSKIRCGASCLKKRAADGCQRTGQNSVVGENTIPPPVDETPNGLENLVRLLYIRLPTNESNT